MRIPPKKTTFRSNKSSDDGKSDKPDNKSAGQPDERLLQNQVSLRVSLARERDLELELEVAEKVMGWVRNKHNKLWPDKKSYGYKNSEGHGLLPAYSADMRAAWEVVELLREQNIFLARLSNVPGDLEGDRENVQKGDGAESSGERDYYICEFETRHYNSLKKFARNSEGPKKSATKRVYSAKERSAPRAICLAALQAMALKAVKNVKKTGTGR